MRIQDHIRSGIGKFARLSIQFLATDPCGNKPGSRKADSGRLSRPQLGTFQRKKVASRKLFINLRLLKTIVLKRGKLS